MPCDSPAGQMINQRGPARARANLSPRQAKEKGLLTSGTYGLPGFISLRSVALTSSLASRLRLQTASRGSTLFELTWKERATPVGQLISALRASVPRTSGSDFGGWPSPVVNDARGSDYAYAQGDHSRPCLKLGGVAKLASWATPAAHEAHGTPERFLERKAALNGKCGVSLTSLNLQAQLTNWISPQAADANGSGINQHTRSLCQQARRQVSGAQPTGSTAVITSGGQLNPAHSRWLMGLPSVWDDCAVTAMQSLPKRRRK